MEIFFQDKPWFPCLPNIYIYVYLYIFVEGSLFSLIKRGPKGTPHETYPGAVPVPRVSFSADMASNGLSGGSDVHRLLGRQPTLAHVVGSPHQQLPAAAQVLWDLEADQPSNTTEKKHPGLKQPFGLPWKGRPC